MKPTIIITVTPEPASYYGAAADDAYLSEHFACQAADEPTAKDVLGKPWNKVHLYRLDGANPPVPVAATDIQVTDPTAVPRDISAESLSRWLDQRKAFDVKDPLNFDQPAAAANLNSAGMLISSITWPAPIPQSAQLLKIFKLQDISHAIDLSKDLFVLPIALDPADQVSADALPDSTRRKITVFRKAADEFQDWTFITNEMDWNFEKGGIKLPTTVAQALDEKAFPLPVNDDGFLFSVRKEADILFLQTFERAGSALFWSLPPLLDLATKLAQKTNGDFKEFCHLGVAVALDPLWVTLISPSDAAREGVLLAPLMRICDKFKTSPATNADLLTSIRDILKPLKIVDLIDGQNSILNAVIKLNEDVTIDDLESVLQKLRSIAASLQSEQGLEQVLTILMEYVKTKLPAADAQHQDRKLYAEWINAYQQILNGPWNALDAIRHDFGHLLCAWLIKQSRANAAHTFRQLIDAAAPYTQRLVERDGNNAWYAAFKDGFVAGAPTIADNEKLLQPAWKQAVDRALGQASNAPITRFVPDRVPQPLPIAVAATSSADGLSQVTHYFNGVAILLQTDKTPKAAHGNLVALHPLKWNGVKLVPQLNWNPGKIALKPFLPVSVDGRREMCVQYYGFPLASPAFAGTNDATVKQADSDPSLAEKRQAFYSLQDAHLEGTNYQKPPRLAYSSTIRACAFAVSKSGTLPKPLQKSTAEPWLPNPQFDISKLSNDIAADFICQRRTAIGSTTFGSRSGQLQRIGAEYPDIHPLSLDFPRVALATGDGGLDTLDLFRGADGRGSMPAPIPYSAAAMGAPEVKAQSRMFLLSGHYVATVGNKPSFKATIEVYQSPNAPILDNVDALASHDFTFAELDKIAGQDLTVEILANGETPNPHPPTYYLPLVLNQKVESTSFLWLRLKITTKAAEATWSFSAPQPSANENPGAHCPSHTPVLVVADPRDKSDNMEAWDRAFTKAAQFNCALSRTTWLDWERWFNNDSLTINGMAHANFKGAAKSLIRAAVMRGLDPRGVLSGLVDRLPDPAVGFFLVELAAVDRFDPKSQNLPTISIIVPAPNWLVNNPLPPPLPNNPTEKQLQEYFENHRRFVNRIDANYQLAFTAFGGDWGLANSGHDNEINVSVPGGTVAKLTVRPLVSLEHFDDKKGGPPRPVVNELMQLAVGKRTVQNKQYLVYPGAELIVEGMVNVAMDKDNQSSRMFAYERLANKHLRLQCGTVSRGYQILQCAVDAKPADKDTEYDHYLRCFSHIDIRTQRWRFSGRPIYHWISPKTYCKKSTDAATAGAVVLEMNREVFEHEISCFESQLYFERDNLDCEIERIRLLGPGTELANITWENPSATYYRHGFTFVSRYSGALRRPLQDALWLKGAVRWTRSVAILADSSRLDVTCPQVRCLVPLSADVESRTVDLPEVVTPSAPRLNGLAPSPPVLCVLEEKPFAVGGLADRVLPEINTGIGFGFEEIAQPQTPDPQVQPIDSGKETSRDGRLESRSWKYDHAPGKLVDPSHLFVLDAEGPVGLHFDRATVPAPAWINCQYLLKPHTIDGKALPEESFFGVRLRRFLEPDWVVEQTPATGKLRPLTQCWEAIEPEWQPLAADKSRDLVVLTCNDQAGVKSTTILSCEVEDDYLVFKFNRQMLNDNYKVGKIAVCAIANKTEGKDQPKVELRIQHLTQGDDHYILNVLARKQAPNLDASIATGSSNIPQILASIPWKIGKDLNVTTGSCQLSIDCNTIRPLTASSATQREWGRSAKNAEWVHCIANGKCAPLPVASLIVKKEPKKGFLQLTFKATEQQGLWPVSSLADSRQPLSVQRHLVGIFTKRSGGMGKQFDLYLGAKLLCGDKPSLKANNEFVNLAAKLHLHELEVPAAIVMTGTPLKDFAEAKLDLIAARPPLADGSSAAPSTRSYRVHVRFANSPQSMNKSSAIKITLASYKNELSNDITTFACADHIRAVDVFLQNGTTWKYRFHGASGNLLPLTDLPIAAPPNLDEIDALGVKLGSTGGGEVWADVSVLQSPAANPDPSDVDAFDFDWLFSEVDMQENSSTRLTSAALSNLTESQARLISMSSAIELQSK